jgi:hypothetical protein
VTCSVVVNSAGLFLDIVGVILVWRFGLPQDVRRSGTSYLLLEETDEAQIAKGKLYDKIAHLGIGLLVVGFGLQLVSNFL